VYIYCHVLNVKVFLVYLVNNYPRTICVTSKRVSVCNLTINYLKYYNRMDRMVLLLFRKPATRGRGVFVRGGGQQSQRGAASSQRGASSSQRSAKYSAHSKHQTKVGGYHLYSCLYTIIHILVCKACC